MTEDEIDRSQWIGDPKAIITHARKLAGNVVAIAGERGGKEYRSLTDPLDFYLSKRIIDERQYDAGNKLRALWHKSTHSAYSQSRYDEYCATGGKIEFLPAGMFAVEYRKAFDSIRGLEPKRVAHFVCCENFAASRCFGSMPRRTAKRHGLRHLMAALDDLVVHFKN